MILFIIDGRMHQITFTQMGGGMGSGAGEGLTLDSLHLGRQQLQVSRKREGGMKGVMNSGDVMDWRRPCPLNFYSPLPPSLPPSLLRFRRGSSTSASILR